VLSAGRFASVGVAVFTALPERARSLDLVLHAVEARVPAHDIDRTAQALKGC
jgi:hypothetical protein